MELLNNILKALSSLVVAIQMISTYCKKLKYKREIVLVTNGTGLINSEDLEPIKDKIKEDNIKLTVLCVEYTLSRWILLTPSVGLISMIRIGE
jgi:ATP-dependent DNA helicase 2 subunit 2